MRKSRTYLYIHPPTYIYIHHIILGGTKPVGAVARVFVIVSFCWLAVEIGFVLPCRRGVAKDERNERTDGRTTNRKRTVCSCVAAKEVYINLRAVDYYPTTHFATICQNGLQARWRPFMGVVAAQNGSAQDVSRLRQFGIGPNQCHLLHQQQLQCIASRYCRERQG